MKGTEGVYLPLTYPGEIGSEYKDVGSFLRHGRPGDTVIWVGDLVGDPLHGVEPRGVRPPGDW